MDDERENAAKPLLKPDGLLPQASPMVLLTGYEEPGEENAATAFVEISPDSPFYVPALGGTPGCTALEYMAQAMALCTGIYRRRKGHGPKMGFVLGSRSLEIRTPVFECGRTYRVRASCDYFDESFGSFDCAVFDDKGETVASARMTAYQPEGDLDASGLEKFQ